MKTFYHAERVPLNNDIHHKLRNPLLEAWNPHIAFIQLRK
jgi:hypothetical protein